MPPSIANRESPQDDRGVRQPTLMSDFHARKKLLAGGEGLGDGKKKKSTKKQALSSSNAVTNTKKKSAVKKTEPSSSTGAAAAGSSASVPTTTNTPLDSSSSALVPTYGSLGGAGLGYGGMMGMYGGGMYGSPYGMGMMGMGMGGPLNSLNQFLFGVQTAIYSLSSAVQVIGMNTQALQQLLDAASSMVDHALATWHEMRALEASAHKRETEEQKKRRRRLKALRWAMVVAATYTAYRILRTLFARNTHRRRRRLPSTSVPYTASSSNDFAMSPYQNSGGYSPYSSSYNSLSPYSSAVGMYGAGAPGYGGSFGGASYY